MLPPGCIPLVTVSRDILMASVASNALITVSSIQDLELMEGKGIPDTVPCCFSAMHPRIHGHEWLSPSLFHLPQQTALSSDRLSPEVAAAISS